MEKEWYLIQGGEEDGERVGDFKIGVKKTGISQIGVRRIRVRKIRARDMTTWAVMAAITVFVNLLGAYTVQFYGGTAMVIITGIGLGPKSGVIVGALARFLCNFFTGQGPWTIWQMASWALIGGISGVLFGKRERLSIWLITVYSFLVVLLFYGGIMNMAALFMANAISPVDTPLNLQTLLAYYATGLPYDLAHGLGCCVCIFIFGENMIRKCQRIKRKYRLSC